jgi:uncharacterized HhH-GPD family protein
MLTNYDPLPLEQKQVVTSRVLEFADLLATQVPVFTPNSEANAMLLADPFAFLSAVIADFGIPAERAWGIPYKLRQRLGHFDVRRISAEGAQVTAAFLESPPLHRFNKDVARWIVDAARRVLDLYAGDAAAIWSNEPTATALQSRFDAFLGIGQKKAAMAVEILAREFRISIAQLHGSDVAFDVHVRRVMLRAGLNERDDVTHVVEAARALYPTRPGRLDLPLWQIGRRWCRPRVPDCNSCVLTAVCPKFVERGDGVTGV